MIDFMKKDQAASNSMVEISKSFSRIIELNTQHNDIIRM